MHLLHCMWFGCIRSCMKELSHRFLSNRWLAHNRFVGLSNPLEVVVHYFLIGGMTGLGYRDEFPVVSAFVCMIIYWTRPMMSYDIRLSSDHDFTNLLYCVISQYGNGAGLGWVAPILTLPRLLKTIPIHVPFKKLNGVGRVWEGRNFPYPV